jgi:NAD(P)H dehydrogenase (quinone)
MKLHTRVLTPSTYISTLTQAGISTEFAGAFAALAEAIKQGELEVSKTDLENLLGRKPTSAKEYLETAFSK